MEEKKKQRWIFKIISFVLVLFCALGITLCYEKIEYVANVASYTDNNMEYTLSWMLPDTMYTLELETKGIAEDRQSEYLKDKVEDFSWGDITEVSKDRLAQIQTIVLDSLLTDIYNGYKEYVGNDPNIDYWAKDNVSGKVVATEKNLNHYRSEKDMQSKYVKVIEMQFDKEGNLVKGNIVNSNGEVSTFEDSDYTWRSNYIFHETDYYDEKTNLYLDYDVKYKGPQDMTYIFAVKDEMIPEGAIFAYTKNNGIAYYVPYAIPYIMVIVMITGLFMLFYPVSIVKECQPYLFLKKIKAELMLFFGGWIYVLAAIGIGILITASINGMYFYLLQKIGWEELSSSIIFVTNVLAWIIVLYMVMYVVFFVKYIFHIGLIRYIKDNTVIGWCFMQAQKAMRALVRFDLESKRNRTILKIVGVNFIALTISLFLGGWPIIAFVYSVALFFFLRKQYDQISDDYGKLLKATRKLSDGEFNFEINEDLGVFNPLRDEFTDIKNGFEKAVREEVKSQKMKTELISNVSHDLKTPLTSIITYVDLLKDESTEEEKKKQYVETLERNALRLKNLIEDLFEVSKVNSGNVSLNLVDVDIVSLIRQAQFECMDKIEEANLDFRVQFSEEKMIYRLDSSKTYRIFENLLINICKYAMPHTRVYINVKEDEEGVLITFKNISAIEIDFDADEIVERFVQGDKSRNSGGSGLGLAIAKSFAELQNGTFKIEIDGDLFKAIIRFSK